jgi:hypothetical protein
MKTKLAIEKAGGTNALARLLGITSGAVSQWGDELPKAREWQLQLLRPEWFQAKKWTGTERRSTGRPASHPKAA